MNLDRIEGNWRRLAGNVKRRWGKLIDRQLELLTGRRDRPKPVAHRQARQQQIERPGNKLSISNRFTGDQS